MHILIATNNIFPDPGAGGSGRYVHEVGKRLVDRGHDVIVLTQRRGDTDVHDQIAGMDIYRCDVSIKTLPVAAHKIRMWAQQQHKRSSIDIINIHNALSGMLINRALPDTISRMYTFHGPWPAEYRERNREKPDPVVRLGTLERRLIENYVLVQCHRTVTLSSFMRSQIEKWHKYVPNGPVIHGGVDIDRFSPTVSSGISLDNGDPAFLTVRRLTPRMGLEHLLEAFSNILLSNEKAHLYIAGDGPLRETLEHRASMLNIAESVTFLGFVSEAHLPSIYSSADVSIMPSASLEGFGLATLESLASGTPVVATDVGGTSEILQPLQARLPNAPSFLVEPNESLADCLEAWIECPSIVYENTRHVIRDYVSERYRWTDITDDVLNLFNEVLNDNR